ncbi:MAG: WbqC family protein [Bacteroidales bacterium]|nr:WbqC family protein [Candidatus Colicola coprequi]
MFLPTAYLPPLEYFRLLPEAQIEVCENFPKRTLRNRALLVPPFPSPSHYQSPITNHQSPITNHQSSISNLTTSCIVHRASCISPLLLTIPVAKANSKQLTRDVRITYQLAWQQQHWHTIEAIYRHTPYFQYFEDYLRPFYERQYTFLIDFNTLLNDTILSLLQHIPPITNFPFPSPSHSHSLPFREGSGVGFPYTSSWHGPLAFPWENQPSVLSHLFDH